MSLRDFLRQAQLEIGVADGELPETALAFQVVIVGDGLATLRGFSSCEAWEAAYSDDADMPDWMLPPDDPFEDAPRPSQDTSEPQQTSRQENAQPQDAQGRKWVVVRA